MTRLASAYCLSCDWSIHESEQTPGYIEFAGPGANGVWQFGTYHEYVFDGHEHSPEAHSVIMEPFSLSVHEYGQLNHH